MVGTLGFRGAVRHGVKPDPVVFVLLLVAATWLAVADLAVAWWHGGAIAWPALWEAWSAAGLALWAMRE